MKKIILAVFASMILASPVYADEEIQLAGVMEDSSSSDLTANKRIYAGSRGGGISQSLEYGVVAGVVIAGVLAVVIDGEINSTSNH